MTMVSKCDDCPHQVDEGCQDCFLEAEARIKDLEVKYCKRAQECPDRFPEEVRQ